MYKSERVWLTNPTTGPSSFTESEHRWRAFNSLNLKLSIHQILNFQFVKSRASTKQNQSYFSAGQIVFNSILCICHYIIESWRLLSQKLVLSFVCFLQQFATIHAPLERDTNLERRNYCKRGFARCAAGFCKPSAYNPVTVTKTL